MSDVDARLLVETHSCGILAWKLGFPSWRAVKNIAERYAQAVPEESEVGRELEGSGEYELFFSIDGGIKPKDNTHALHLMPK